MSPTPAGFRITHIHAFIAVGDDDEEGVIGFLAASGWMPMIAADPARLEQLRPLAESVARETGTKVTLARFGVREDLEVIE